MDERANKPSASGLERLALCPGSFALERTCPPDPESAEAGAGTRIHNDLAFCLSMGLREPISLTDEEAETFRMCRDVALATIQAWEDPEGPKWQSKVEEREWLHQGLEEVASGQYDALLIQGRRALVIDYKTGHGDQTEGPRNLQLRALAVIVAETEAVDEVTVALIQPWATMKPQTCRYTKEDLAFARGEIMHILSVSQSPDAPLVPGNKQCRYCRAKAICPAINGQVERFGNLALRYIDDTDLPNLLELCGAVEEAVGVIRARAKRMLEENPASLPGWALGKRRTTRHIKDAQAAFQKLSSALTADEFASCCNPSVAELEKLFKKTLSERTGLTQRECGQQFAHLLAGVVLTKESAPQLVRAKPALEVAA